MQALIGKEVPQWKTYLEIKPALLLQKFLIILLEETLFVWIWIVCAGIESFIQIKCALIGYFIGDWVSVLNKRRLQIVEWALTPTAPDPPSVRSALANIARREATCGIAVLVNHCRNDVSDPMCEVASQTNIILIT